MLIIQTDELKKNLWMTKFADIPFSDGPHKLSSGILAITRHHNQISGKEFHIKLNDLTDEELKTNRVFFEVDINAYNVEGDATAYYELPPAEDYLIQNILAAREKKEDRNSYSDEVSSKLPEAIADSTDQPLKIPDDSKGFMGRISGFLRTLATLFISIFKYFKSLLRF